MSESSNELSVPLAGAGSATTRTFDERWVRWQEKGARRDARIARTMRLIAAITLTIAGIWAAVSLL